MRGLDHGHFDLRKVENELQLQRDSFGRQLERSQEEKRSLEDRTVENGKYFVGLMTMRHNVLMMEVEHDGYQEVSSLVLDKVIILGLRSGVETVVVNGLPHLDWSLDSNGGLIITSLGLQPNDRIKLSR